MATSLELEIVSSKALRFLGFLLYVWFVGALKCIGVLVIVVLWYMSQTISKNNANVMVMFFLIGCYAVHCTPQDHFQPSIFNTEVRLVSTHCMKVKDCIQYCSERVYVEFAHLLCIWVGRISNLVSANLGLGKVLIYSAKKYLHGIFRWFLRSGAKDILKFLFFKSLLHLLYL